MQINPSPSYGTRFDIYIYIYIYIIKHKIFFLLILLRLYQTITATRIATLLREYSDGITLDDELLIETVLTKSNAELKEAYKGNLIFFK